jgi:hypothetical protein
MTVVRESCVGDGMRTTACFNSDEYVIVFTPNACWDPIVKVSSGILHLSQFTVTESVPFNCR